MTIAHSPLTLQLKSGVYLSLHEAALVDYAGMSLRRTEGNILQADLAPSPHRAKVALQGAFKTPWRTVLVSDTAHGLVDNYLMLNLNEANILGDVSWVEPGKYVGIWWEMHLAKSTWESGKKHGATTANTRRYIDFAAQHGFSGVLVEGWNIGWDGNWFDNVEQMDFDKAYPAMHATRGCVWWGTMKPRAG